MAYVYVCDDDSEYCEYCVACSSHFPPFALTARVGAIGTACHRCGDVIDADTGWWRHPTNLDAMALSIADQGDSS